MIPDRVIEILQGPSFLQVGTRNARLEPAHASVTGLVVDADRETVTFFVNERRARRILSDLEDNGRVALTAAQATHEAYQVKGSYVSSHPATDEEYAVQEAYHSMLWVALTKFFPEEMAKGLILGAAYRPSVAIRFRVEEVFLQTPGPDAGKRMA